MFQSPSLRGSGRFPTSPQGGGQGGQRFNPLHCGAVVASLYAMSSPGSTLLVSIPFIAGQWSLHLLRMEADQRRDRRVSIPFIAGQWSLPPAAWRRGREDDYVSIPFIAGQWSLRSRRARPPGSDSCFNPLHCGAVVASPPRADPENTVFLFQSPSLRGSGRFFSITISPAAFLTLFQSPSLRGSGRFAAWRCSASMRRTSFNPLHCGAVVASRAARNAADLAEKFQSPSLRGSGRFLRLRSRPSPHGGCFNPLHCGAVVASKTVVELATRLNKVSIPFIAGQWSLRAAWRGAQRGPRVSIPFIAGQWSLRLRLGPSGRFLPRFNPLHCGAVVASRRRARRRRRAPRFNPLHCGAVVASPRRTAGGQGGTHVSIPFIAGQWSLRFERVLPALRKYGFQSPSLRGSGRFYMSHITSVRLEMFHSPSLRGSGRFERGKGG